MKPATAAAAAVMICIAAAAQGPAEEFSPAEHGLGAECRQAVVVAGDGGSMCRISLMSRQDGSDGGAWVCDMQTQGSAGVNGLVAAERKREGDGKTPCGTYALKRGLWRRADIDTHFAMELYDEGCLWVDDETLPEYNTLVREAGQEWDGRGERLSQVGEPYDYIVVVEYNTDPVIRGMGSAIFLHVWRGESAPTAGCVAMSPDDMRRLVQWLDPDKSPAIVIMRQGGGTNETNDRTRRKR